MWPNPQETADLVTFTEEIRNEKFFFVQCTNPVEWNTADAEVYLGAYQTSMTERFCENSLQLKVMLFIYLFICLFIYC